MHDDNQFDEAEQYAFPEAGIPSYEMANEDDGIIFSDRPSNPNTLKTQLEGRSLRLPSQPQRSRSITMGDISQMLMGACGTLCILILTHVLSLSVAGVIVWIIFLAGIALTGFRIVKSWYAGRK